MVLLPDEVARIDHVAPGPLSVDGYETETGRDRARDRARGEWGNAKGGSPLEGNRPVRVGQLRLLKRPSGLETGPVGASS
jgi:hypothetical protein